MNSSRTDIREEFVALDTNGFHFALRRDDRYPGRAKLYFERALDLRLHVPLQVLKGTRAEYNLFSREDYELK
jgi:hypothetical protein